MQIIRGQRIRLHPSRGASIHVDVELSMAPGIIAESLCLMVGTEGQAVSGGLVVGCGSTSNCGGVELHPAGFVLKLDRIPDDVDRLVLGLELRARGPGPAEASALGVCHATVRQQGNEAVQYDFAGRDFGRETALQVVEIYRKEGWRMMAVGAGFLGGLRAMASQYGARLPSSASSSAGAAPSETNGLEEKIRLPVAWPAGIPPVVPKGLVGAVGLIVVETSRGDVHTGTGFAISPGGLMLTADHTISDSKQISVAMHGTGELRRGEVLARSPELDIALLWLADRQGATAWLLLGEPGSRPELGEEVGLLAFPLGLELGAGVTYSQGIVNSHRNLDGRSVLQIDAGAAPGSSGGPLIRRRDGRIVGILIGGRPGGDKGMHINFATDIQMLYGVGWLVLPVGTS